MPVTRDVVKYILTYKYIITMALERCLSCSIKIKSKKKERQWRTHSMCCICSDNTCRCPEKKDYKGVVVVSLLWLLHSVVKVAHSSGCLAAAVIGECVLAPLACCPVTCWQVTMSSQSKGSSLSVTEVPCGLRAMLTAGAGVDVCRCFHCLV